MGQPTAAGGAGAQLACPGTTLNDSVSDRSAAAAPASSTYWSSGASIVCSSPLGILNVTCKLIKAPALRDRRRRRQWRQRRCWP